MKKSLSILLLLLTLSSWAPAQSIAILTGTITNTVSDGLPNPRFTTSPQKVYLVFDFVTGENFKFGLSTVAGKKRFGIAPSPTVSGRLLRPAVKTVQSAVMYQQIFHTDDQTSWLLMEGTVSPAVGLAIGTQPFPATLSYNFRSYYAPSGQDTTTFEDDKGTLTIDRALSKQANAAGDDIFRAEQRVIDYLESTGYTQ